MIAKCLTTVMTGMQLSSPSMCLFFFFFLLLSPVKHSGSVTFDDILGVARAMRPRSIARELSGECQVGQAGPALLLLVVG